MRIVESADDVTEAVLADAGQVWDGWFADEPRIDWEAFVDRLANDYGNAADEPYDFESYDSPAVRKIQRHVRALARDA